MKKILITDSVDKKSVAVLTSAGFDVTYQPGMPKEEIKQVIKDYEGLVVRSDTKVTADIIACMEKMEVIGRAGTGVDNIDSEAATRKGVIVMNTPGGNTISTAEHAISLMLSMCRNIPQATASLKAGKWERKKFQGSEVYGKTLGVVGLGKIGREVAVRMKAFGMQVIGYDPILSEETGAKIGVKLVDLDTLFASSDIITVHVPLDEKTQNLLRKETFEKCKAGVKLVNCARGGIINEDDLVDALNSGKVSAVAFDVYVSEPPDYNHPLIQHPKVVTTPHLGASTGEAQEKVAIQIAEQMVDYFNNKGLRGAVNAAAIEAFGNPELAPYVRLAENIGSLQGQILQNKLKKIKITFYGELLSQSHKLISSAVTKGFLSKHSSDPLNLINAPFLAAEMGIAIEEVYAGANSDYTNLLAVECSSASEGKYLAGTVFGNNEIRIVDIDKFHLELKPEGAMLFYTNIDKPGVLAQVGKILAENKINIAGLSLGRFGIGKEAITVVNVDSTIDKSVLREITLIEGINNAYTVKI